jgi:hypothetical protein
MAAEVEVDMDMEEKEVEAATVTVLDGNTEAAMDSDGTGGLCLARQRWLKWSPRRWSS